MKKYLDEIIHLIDLQKNKSENITIVRLEGFENPIIYKEVCKYFKAMSKVNLHAKLSREKYLEFKEAANNDWSIAINFLENNNFVDYEGAMTKWRNNSADIGNDGVTKNLVLLMGTESVPDKGGLADFYKITPESILEIVKKDYSTWFKEIVPSVVVDKAVKKGINTFFKVLFKNININLVVLSKLVDELENVQILSEDDLIEEICYRLSKDWEIPSIKNEKMVPKLKNLKRGTINSAAIIEKSYKFISRSQFSKGVTKKALKNYEDKIDKYAEENNIEINEKFPSDNPIFDSYNEFKYALIDFIKGKDNKELKEKFLNIDFAIVDSILNFKIISDTTDALPKEKDNKVSGEPLEAYTEMVTKTVYDFVKGYSVLPKEIEFKVNEIKLTNCNDKDEEIILLNRLSLRLGGILDYLTNGNDIKIKYLNDNDPFNLSDIKNRKNIVIKSSTNINELSKIKFTVSARNDKEDKGRKKEFTYIFSNLDSWFNDYLLLEKDLLNDGHENECIPLYMQCSNMKQYINCEAEEEFFIKLQKIKTEVIFSEIQTDISGINNNEILGEFGNLIYEYNRFLTEYNEKGIYSIFSGENLCKKIFTRYSNLLRVVRKNYNNLTETEKISAKVILNLFLIGDKEYNEFKNGKCNQILLSPIHPIMLEKVFYKNEHIRKSMIEIIKEIQSSKIDEKKLQKQIGYISQMSSINSGFDVFTLNEESKLITDKMYGKYAIYNLQHDVLSLLTDNGVRNDLIEIEEENKNISKKSHKSEIIAHNLIDYLKTFPARADGVNLLFINPDDMQHIVSGISTAVQILNENSIKASINVRILVSLSRRSSEGYLKYWLNNHYELNCGIKVRTFLNYIDFESNNLQEQVDRYVRNQDITYIYNVLENTNVAFMLGGNSSYESEIKYPAIYTPMPISITQESRAIDISQKQFESANEHLQLLHKSLRPNEIEGSYRAVKRMEISDIQKKILNYIHSQARWVVCLDETIDKNILNSEESKIIGFSTGKGLFGELNTTVSARIDVLEDLQEKLKYKLLSKFNNWLPEVAEKAASNCIEISKNLDGSKMLKALNPKSTEIHNFLAYVMTMQVTHMISEEDNVIKVLLNLDNYLHWFDDSLTNDYKNENNKRPDFIVLEIEKDEELFNEDKPLKIKATVIECKLSKENNDYISEAIGQVKVGIDKLANKFNPNSNSINRRYWFNQLYRALVFSKINMRDNEQGYNILINKLSGIFDGKFDIEWYGKIYAYWIDQNSLEFKRTIIEHDNIENYKLNEIAVYTAGQLFIQKLLLPKEVRDEVNIEFSISEEKVDNEFANQILGLESEIVDSDINAHINKNSSTETNSVSKIRASENTSIDNSKLSESIDEAKNINVIETDDNYMKVEDNAKEENKSLNNTNSLDEVKAQNKKDYGRFLLGEDIRTKEKIYWEYMNKELNNRHLLINGNSGSGKTYCIQTLILEAVKNNISVIVFDYTDGFTKSKLSPVLVNQLGDKFEERYVKFEKFPINPFKRGKMFYGGREFVEPDMDVANRIADSFMNVYKFGDQQRSAIYSAVIEGIKERGDSMTLETLKSKLEESTNKTASTVISKMLSLVDYDPFIGDTHFSWGDIVNEKGKMYVIQLSGFTREIQLILTELILWDIWNYAVRNGNEDKPMPLVLDEAQNLSHKENTPSGKILAEGRKFGVSGWYATQFMKGRLTPSEIGNLQQAAQKLYFSPPEESIVEVSKYIDITTDGSKKWAEKLTKLTKGYCVTAGYMVRNNKIDKYDPKIIKITSLEDRVNE